MAIEIPTSLSHSHHHPDASSTTSDEIATTSTSTLQQRQHHCHPPSRIKSAGTDLQQHHQQQKQRLSLSILGLFIFYIGHDAIQERMFRLDGFEYGFFMTFVEVLVMLLLASMILHEDESNTLPPPRKGKKTNTSTSTRPPLSTATMLRIAYVGLLLALAHGLGNTSLNYSPYPLKVAFKSCKLVPTMAVGACLTYDKRYTALQYTAALIMGLGLAVLSSADTTTTTSSASLVATNDESSSRILVAEDAASHNNNSINSVISSSSSSTWHDTIISHLGPLLLTISTALDSAVPNIQEQLLRSKRVHTSDMIRISNGVMCACLAIYTYLSGELVLAWTYCAHRKDASVLLLLQGICAYFGLRCYLSIIREYGGVMGVLLANARKVITIVLSFVLFAKPFNERHVVGLILVGVGVYLGCISKSMTKEKKDMGQMKKSDEDNNSSSNNSNNIMKATVYELDDDTLPNGEEEGNKLHEHSV